MVREREKNEVNRGGERIRPPAALAITIEVAERVLPPLERWTPSHRMAPRWAGAGLSVDGSERAYKIRGAAGSAGLVLVLSLTRHSLACPDSRLEMEGGDGRGRMGG